MSTNVTREGIEVKVDQTWRDLDKRSNGRTRTIVAIEDGKAVMDGPTRSKVSIHRMHKSSTGWELVQETK